MVAILKEDSPELSVANRNVSPGLDRLVRHCLEKNPERRFQSAKDLAYDLETLSGVSGVVAAPGILAPTSRKRRKVLLAAALIGIGILAGWGLSVIRPRPSTPSYRRLTFRRGTVIGARFAPDGQTVVYTAAWEGQPFRIFATRAGSIESRSLQLPDARVLAVSSTGELAISIGHETTRTGEKFALHAVTPSGRERLVRREAGGLYLHDISRDGRVLLNDYFMYSSLVGMSAGESAERELSWLDQSYVNAISNDGQLLVFDEVGEGRSESETIYVRAVDGSPAVRLSYGHGLAFSPDGRWVLSWPSFSSENFVLLPTGPGQPKTLPHRGITAAHLGRYFPDGKRILFLGRTGSGFWRLYVQNLDGGDPKAVSPEGISGEFVAVSPDGRLVAAQGPDSKIAIYPVDGGAPRPLAGAEAEESPILWSSDDQSLYAYRRNEAPARVFKIDIATGKRELWKTIAPADRSGLITIENVVMTPDARSYAYSYLRILTSLELAEGLR